MKFNQAGRSMIEMLGVLAIIGVLSVAGLYGYQKAMIKHKTNKTIDQIATIINNMRTAFANSGSSQYPYKGIKAWGDCGEQSGCYQLISLNIFPEEMLRTESGVTKVYNLYQGEVKVNVDSNGEYFMLDFEDLPKDVTIVIGTIDWGMSDVSGLQEVEICGGENCNTEQQQNP